MDTGHLLERWRSMPPAPRFACTGAVLLACQLVGWPLAAAIGPAPPTLVRNANGDEALAALVRETLGADTRGFDAMAVIAVDGPDVRFAAFGRQRDGMPITPDSAFEIGSLTKPLTGMLLADLIDAGRLEPETTLGEATRGRLELDGPGTDVSLADLATHRSGWPRLPPSAYPRAILSSYGRGNAYAGTADELLRTAAAQRSERGEYAYSNLGFAALGHALAVHEGVDYAALLERRLLAPLGMRDTHVVGRDDTLPGNRVPGRTASGLSSAPWRADAWQPTGVGVWSTPEDLSRLMTAVLAGTAPGLRASEPSTKIDSRTHVGYGWMIEDDDGAPLLWHNGGTGGFRTWLGVSSADARGVAVLSNTDVSVDALGRRLLLDERGASLVPRSAGAFGWALALFAVAGAAVPLLTVARAVRGGDGDRHDLVRSVSSALQALLLTRALVPWNAVPTALWHVGAGLGLTCALGAALAWSGVPAVRGSRPGRRLARTLAGVAVTVALVALSP